MHHRHKLRTLIVTIFAVCGVSVCSSEGETYVEEAVQSSDHYVFNQEQKVDGVTFLVRDLDQQVVRANVISRALEPNYAYSIWWAVFNNPQYCVEPDHCSINDLERFGGDPRVNASVFWGGGIVADGDGNGSVSLELRCGRTERELFAGSKNYGLRDITTAEIHVVLRSHGLAGATGSLLEQLGKADSACPEPTCLNVFASIHRPPT